MAISRYHQSLQKKAGKIDLPLELPSGALFSPNIFDIIKKAPIPKEKSAPKHEPIKYQLILRPTDELFETPKKLKDKPVETRKDELLAPFKKALCTIGSRIEEQGKVSAEFSKKCVRF